MTDSELIKTAAALLRSVSALSNLVMDDNERMKANSACIARDVGAALEDYNDECARSRALLTALEDIALCRVPALPCSVLTSPETFENAAREHAATAIRVYEGTEPTPMMKDAIAMHDSLLKSK